MSKGVTFIARTDLVEVYVRGEDGVQGRSLLPKVPDDHGLITRLFDFMRLNGVEHYRVLEAGGGRVLMLLYKEQAARVVEWLRREGCRDVGATS